MEGTGQLLGNILCDLDPKEKAKGKKVGICDGVPSTAALVFVYFDTLHPFKHFFSQVKIIFCLPELKQYCIL